MSTNHHTFPYNPFSHVKADRQKTLRQLSDRLLAGQLSLFGGTVNFTKLGDILNEISRNAIYGTDTDEKSVSWCFIVAILGEVKITVLTEGLLQENIDRWGTGVTYGHIAVSFADPRHGTVGGSDSYTDGSLAQAETEIDAYERQLKGVNLPFNIRNDGDAAASLNTVRTMFAFRTGGFAAFAREWNRVFLGR